jgi:hypothetical protein
MQGYSGDVVIVLGTDGDALKKCFGEVTQRAPFQDEYIQPLHNNLPIFVVRKPKRSLALRWSTLKEYI